MCRGICLSVWLFFLCLLCSPILVGQKASGEFFFFIVSLFIFSTHFCSVKTLKKAIASKAGIPEDKQSLLISGGETLHDDARICSYRAAGTETNPIFLFNRETIESDNPPPATVDYGQNPDMKERIDSCLIMEPSYNTVVSRAELAQQLYEIAHQQLSACERMVQDQHLQHQGWAAVIANLDDKSKELVAKSVVLKAEYDKLIDERKSFLEIISKYVINFFNLLSLNWLIIIIFSYTVFRVI